MYLRRRVAGGAACCVGCAFGRWPSQPAAQEKAGSATDAVQPVKGGGRAEAADCIVVGGGIVGAVVARDLARRGAEVVLLERSSCGSEASGLSAGTLWSAGMPRLVTERDAATYLRAGSSELLRSLGEACEYNRCGALELAVTPEDVCWLRQDCEAGKRKGLAVEWVEGVDLIMLEPALAGGSALAAIHTPLSGSVQPALATRAIADQAESAGSRVIEGEEALSIDRSQDGSAWVVCTSGGQRFAAAHVVLAAGAWSAPLAATAGVRLPVVPVKGVICTSPAPPSTLRKVIYECSSRRHFTEVGDGRNDLLATPAKCTHGQDGTHRLVRKLYAKQCGPSDEHQLVFGGDRIPGVRDDDYSVPEETERAVWAHATELFPAAIYDLVRGTLRAASDEAGAWAGLMPFSADGKPIVGELAPLGLPNLWMACGFGPSGVMEGPMAASLLAARLAARLGFAGDGDGVGLGGDEEQRAVMRAIDPCREGCCARC